MQNLNNSPNGKMDINGCDVGGEKSSDCQLEGVGSDRDVNAVVKVPDDVLAVVNSESKEMVSSVIDVIGLTTFGEQHIDDVAHNNHSEPTAAAHIDNNGRKRAHKPRTVFSPDDFIDERTHRKQHRKQKGRTRNQKAIAHSNKSKWDILGEHFTKLFRTMGRESHCLDALSVRKQEQDTELQLSEINACADRLQAAKLAIREFLHEATDQNSADRRFPQLAEEDEEGMVDLESIPCSRCGLGDCEGNDILFCDRKGCMRAYHQLCLDVPMADFDGDAEEGMDWFCWQCEFLDDCFEMLNDMLDTDFCIWSDVFEEEVEEVGVNSPVNEDVNGGDGEGDAQEYGEFDDSEDEADDDYDGGSSDATDATDVSGDVSNSDDDDGGDSDAAEEGVQVVGAAEIKQEQEFYGSSGGEGEISGGESEYSGSGSDEDEWVTKDEFDGLRAEAGKGFYDGVTMNPHNGGREKEYCLRSSDVPRSQIFSLANSRQMQKQESKRREAETMKKYLEDVSFCTSKDKIVNQSVARVVRGEVKLGRVLDLLSIGTHTPPSLPVAVAPLVEQPSSFDDDFSFLGGDECNEPSDDITIASAEHTSASQGIKPKPPSPMGQIPSCLIGQTTVPSLLLYTVPSSSPVGPIDVMESKEVVTMDAPAISDPAVHCSDVVSDVELGCTRTTRIHHALLPQTGVIKETHKWNLLFSTEDLLSLDTDGDDSDAEDWRDRAVTVQITNVDTIIKYRKLFADYQKTIDEKSKRRQYDQSQARREVEIVSSSNILQSNDRKRACRSVNIDYAKLHDEIFGDAPDEEDEEHEEGDGSKALTETKLVRRRRMKKQLIEDAALEVGVEEEEEANEQQKRKAASGPVVKRRPGRPKKQKTIEDNSIH